MTINDKDVPPGPVAAALVGNWEYRYKDDGRYDVLFNDRPALAGSYALTSDTIEFNPDGGACAPFGPGIYQWKLDGNVLTLTVVKDACVMRPLLFATRPWTKK